MFFSLSHTGSAFCLGFPYHPTSINSSAPPPSIPPHTRLPFKERRRVCLRGSCITPVCLSGKMTLETKHVCLGRLLGYRLRLPTTQDSLYLSPFSSFSHTLCFFSLSQPGKSTRLSLGDNSDKYSRALNTPREAQLSPKDNMR